MFSRSPEALFLVAMIAVAFLGVSCAHSNAAQVPLRVCADPNNLPFSNDRLEGFENRIAELVSSELHRPLQYTWWAQRRGFFRNTLNAGLCDVVVGVPSNFELALTTSPYYTSSYVFVSRKDRRVDIRSMDDPRLRRLLVGVQLIGDDADSTPPAVVLGKRGITQNVRGFTLYGDYSQPNPPARIIDAVSNGAIDLAIVWGPLAGYFAKQQPIALELVQASPPQDLSFLRFVYSISMGVRKADVGLRNQLDAILARNKSRLERILGEFGVPRLPAQYVENARE